MFSLLIFGVKSALVLIFTLFASLSGDTYLSESTIVPRDAKTWGRWGCVRAIFFPWLC